jgi:hypothetical protein
MLFTIILTKFKPPEYLFKPSTTVSIVLGREVVQHSQLNQTAVLQRRQTSTRNPTGRAHQWQVFQPYDMKKLLSAITDTIHLQLLACNEYEL